MRSKRRPPHPKHPKFAQFHRSGLHFGRIHPQHRQCGDSSKAYGDCHSVRGRRSLAGHRKRRTEPHVNNLPTGMEGAGGSGGPDRGAGGRQQGLAMLRDDAPIRINHHDPTGVGSAGGHGWPGPTAPGIPARQGCGARGRRQGLAGQRADTPSDARSADGSRAGRRPRAQAHQAARLSKRAGRSTSITTTPQVWRAPEGPEGTGGLRGAAPSEARSPSLAGGRSLRCSEHPWGLKRLRLGNLSACLARNALAARFAQGQAAVAVDGRTHVDEARAC